LGLLANLFTDYGFRFLLGALVAGVPRKLSELLKLVSSLFEVVLVTHPNDPALLLFLCVSCNSLSN
jgi:hypothetical protein